MKFNRILQIFVVGIAYCLVACSTPADRKTSGTTLPEGALGGTVVSATEASSYVIMELQHEQHTFWAAAAYRDLKPGDEVQLIGAMMMKDFTVKSLERTFAEIYFASALVVNGEIEASAEADTASSPSMQLPDGHPDVAAMQQANVSGSPESKTTAHEAVVQPLENGVSIQQLLENPEKFNGQTIRVRGLAVKFLDGIMKRNWIHLKDNTCGDSHLTVTTSEAVSTGDVLVIEGVVRTDVDFGHGYQYAVLVEDARIQPEGQPH